MPLKQKPPGCRGCALEHIGEGFVPAQGPVDAEILFLGEAPGEVESFTGLPFSGPSGAMQDRVLHKVKLDRKQVDRKSTRLNSSHMHESRMPSSA